MCLSGERIVATIDARWGKLVRGQEQLDDLLRALHDLQIRLLPLEGELEKAGMLG